MAGFVDICTRAGPARTSPTSMFRAAPAAPGGEVWTTLPWAGRMAGQPLPSSSCCLLLLFKRRSFPCVLIAQASNRISPEIFCAADLISTSQQGVLGKLQPLCVNNLIPEKHLPNPKFNLNLKLSLRKLQSPFKVESHRQDVLWAAVKKHTSCMGKQWVRGEH